jgi:hypothetical protein
LRGNAVVPISRDPADYRYAPPAERSRRVGVVLGTGGRCVGGAVGLILGLGSLLGDDGWFSPTLAWIIVVPATIAVVVEVARGIRAFSTIG